MRLIRLVLSIGLLVGGIAATGLASVPASAATAPCTVTANASNNWEPGCGPYADPTITPNYDNTFVNLNGWNCGSPPGCGPLSETVNSPSDFTVSADEPAGNTAVMMFPSAYQVYWSASKGGYINYPVATSHLFRSTFTESMPTTPGTDAWAAYDMFVNNSGTSYNEMMVQTQNVGGCISCAPAVGQATFFGQSWTLHTYGGEMIWDLTNGDNESTGTVHLLAMLKWLQSHGYIGASSTFNSVGFGWEICSTGGVPENFSVSSFGLIARA